VRTEQPRDLFPEAPIAVLLTRLADRNYADLAALSDDDILNILFRIHREPLSLAAFNRFLEHFLAWYREHAEQHTEAFERFVRMAPMLRRDEMQLVRQRQENG